jgi:hypothetical protein
MTVNDALAVPVLRSAGPVLLAGAGGWTASCAGRRNSA